jgi:DNA-binding NarL/FixJ family response regulator
VTPVRVLIVDDHEPFRDAVAAMVGELDGFTVVGCAASGEESLTPAAVGVDLVLMDVKLPGISGIEATRRITARPDAPLVVLLSTYDEGELDHEGSGAAAYLSKSALAPERLVALWTAISRPPPAA